MLSLATTTKGGEQVLVEKRERTRLEARAIKMNKTEHDEGRAVAAVEKKRVVKKVDAAGKGGKKAGGGPGKKTSTKLSNSTRLPSLPYGPIKPIQSQDRHIQLNHQRHILLQQQQKKQQALLKPQRRKEEHQPQSFQARKSETKRNDPNIAQPQLVHQPTQPVKLTLERARPYSFTDVGSFDKKRAVEKMRNQEEEQLKLAPNKRTPRPRHPPSSTSSLLGLTLNEGQPQAQPKSTITQPKVEPAANQLALDLYHNPWLSPSPSLTPSPSWTSNHQPLPAENCQYSHSHRVWDDEEPLFYPNEDAHVHHHGIKKEEECDDDDDASWLAFNRTN